MTNDELRVAIAKAKGWKLYRFDYFGERNSQAIFSPDYRPDSRKTQIDFSELDAKKFVGFDNIPNWPENIADAWELEEELNPSQRSDYGGCLASIVTNNTQTIADYDWALIHATPRQRCEAWLACKASA